MASANTASSYATDAAVVTGASSGIGRAAAKALIDRGWRVFGSVRKEADAEATSEALGPAFTPLLFDVTDDGAIRDAASDVADALEGRTLKGLVNNAGIALAGPVRYLPLETVERQFDVNIFGVVRTTQAFLPLLGADTAFKGAPGKIVNMSSVAGKIATPFMAPYAMSKHALEALSASLRRELIIHGIDVVVVGPGAVKTPIWDKGEDLDISLYIDTEYGELLERMRGLMTAAGEGGLPAEAIGTLVADILEGKERKTRYAILRNKFTNWTLPRLFPERMLDKAIAGRFGIKRRKR
ncbi:MAG: SDR family NAD(P)-dependent oxidoreductase [Pseudomonadota bacterium]